MKKQLLILLHISFIVNVNAQEYCFSDRFSDTVFGLDEIEVLSDIVYGTAIDWNNNEKQLFLDVYQPDPLLDSLALRPCILFIHGGGFRGGSKNSVDLIDVAENFTRMGFVTVAINYRLGWDNIGDCGGDTASLERAKYRALQDARSAIRYIKEYAGTYRIDTNRLIVAGFSAGANTALKAVYTTQDDFPAYLLNELGSIDSSGNMYYNHSTDVYAMMLKAPGLELQELKFENGVPTMFVHGTCDMVAPYVSGPLYSCYTPITYPITYGSRYMSDLFMVEGIPYHLYTIEGGEHGDPEDSVIVDFMQRFLTDLLCDQLESTEFYLFNNGGCFIESESQLDVEIAPNPVQDVISLTITSGVEGVYEIRIYNVHGQLMHASQANFEPPVRKFGIDIGSTPMSRGLYFLEVSSRIYNGVYTFFKE